MIPAPVAAEKNIKTVTVRMHKQIKPLSTGVVRLFLKRIPLVMVFLLLVDCSGQQEISALCKSKISAALISMVSETADDGRPIEIVVTVSDSTGIQPLFPSLTFPNANVALGHLTRREIFSLCSVSGVSYIDKPRISFPK